MGRVVSLRGAAAKAFIDAHKTMNKKDPTDEDRYNALATGIALAFKEGTKEGVAGAIESLRLFEQAAILKGRMLEKKEKKRK